MPYIDATDISATVKAARYAELTTDEGAEDYAIDTANAEMESILITTYSSVATCPANVRAIGGLIGKYHLFAFNELLDPEDPVSKDYDRAIKHLREMAAGREAGIDDPDSETDDPVRYSSRQRLFDDNLEDYND